MGEETSFYSWEKDAQNGEKVIHFDFGDKKCEILPFESPMPPDMMPQYVKMPISESNKGQISALYQQIPALMTANALKDAYYVIKWPDGLPHKLIPFADGLGLMGIVRGERGQFGGVVRLQPLDTQALVLEAFTVMSIVTSQYFLTEINQKLSKISLTIDKILAFLHGDKKAELLSENNFVKYAHDNFEHSEQRAATIHSIQEARKTAIQDVEFYLGDLHSAVHEKITDEESVVDKAFQIRQCLDLSIQLYMTANLLEVYYSQNYDPVYLEYVKTDVGSYIDKYEKQLIADFNALKMVLLQKQAKLGKKAVIATLIKKVTSVLDCLMNGEGNKLKAKLNDGLNEAENEVEYCIAPDGAVYLKKSA